MIGVILESWSLSKEEVSVGLSLLRSHLQEHPLQDLCPSVKCDKHRGQTNCVGSIRIRCGNVKQVCRFLPHPYAKSHIIYTRYSIKTVPEIQKLVARADLRA
jgi:hypothetical protein